MKLLNSHTQDNITLELWATEDESEFQLRFDGKTFMSIVASTHQAKKQANSLFDNLIRKGFKNAP